MLIQKTLKFKDSNAPVEAFVADSVKELAGGTYRATIKNPNSYRWDTDREHFLGRAFPSLKDAVDASTQRWDEGLKVIWNMIQKLKGSNLPILESRKRKRTWKPDEGDEVDLDKMRAGQEYWQKSERQTVEGPGTLTIIADTNAYCGMSPNQLLWRGATAVALTYLLEEAGYRVALWATRARSKAYRDGSDFMYGVRIKNHKDPLNIGQAASAISAWFYRSIGFHAANMAAARRPCGSAGAERRDGARPFIRLISDDETNFIVQNVFNEEEALDYVQRSAVAINKGQIAALPWAYSYEKCPTFIVVTFIDPFDPFKKEG